MRILRLVAIVCNLLSMIYWARNAYFIGDGIAAANHMTMPYRIVGLLMMVCVMGFTSTISFIVLLFLPRSLRKSTALPTQIFDGPNWTTTQTCELRDNSRAGAGWEVQILEAGEILLSRQCATEREARYVAEAAKKDSLRTGSVLIVD
jgi:hypothetical protein